jgi:peptide/nickel transport system substrate-binding protein
LSAAGFKKGSDGIYQSPSGQPLSFTIKTISGYSDWDASLQIITQELKAVGIAVTVQDENSTPYTSDIQGGHFQLAYAGSGGPAASPGPSPYYELRGWLFSGNIGSTNYSRYTSQAADNLFNEYPAVSQSQQVQIIHQIQKLMVDDIPFIPTTEGVDWYQYDTTNITGWPTESNPYAQPSPYSFPDDGQVVTHLRSTG